MGHTIGLKELDFPLIIENEGMLAEQHEEKSHDHQASRRA
jgi:hypothetical protein